MANEGLILDYESLLIEYRLLEDELKNLDDLFNEVRDEKLENSKSGSRKSYVFISNQNSNLQSIRNSKLSVISKMSDIKRTMLDVQLKVFTANKSNDDRGSDDNATIRAIYGKLLNLSNEDIMRTIKNKDEVDDNETEYLLDEVLDSFDIDGDGNAFIPDTSKEDILDNSTEELFNRLTGLLDSNNLEMVVDANTGLFIFLSSLDEDYGTIVESDYIDKLSELKDLIDNHITILDRNEERMTVNTNIGMELELVEIE